MAYVYLIQSLAVPDRRYIGMTADLEERRRVHNSGGSPAFAGSHGSEAVEECGAGVRRSLGEGGHTSAGSAEVIKWEGPRL